MARKISQIGIFLSLLLGASGTAFAFPLDCANVEANGGKVPNDILSRVEQRYQQIDQLNAEFVQESYFAGLEKREASSGTFHFKARGKMDWVYEHPTEQRFVSDGKTVWFYEPELNQVTIGDFEGAFDSDLPVSFMIGLGSLKDDFTMKKVCRSQDVYLLDLVPKKPSANFQAFVLAVSAKDYSPTGARISDLGGNETSIQLVQLDFSKAFPDAYFEFQIPRGVLPVDNRSKIETPSGELKEKDLISGE